MGDRFRYFMRLALEEARKAFEEGEVPIGAVLVKGEEVLARDHNRTLSLGDPTAHAEVLVLREGARLMGNYRLNGTELFVTVEPCLMCSGALVWARVERLVFGCRDHKGGALSLYGVFSDGKLNHRPEVVEGVLAEESRELLQRFFKERRGTEAVVTGPTRNRLCR